MKACDRGRTSTILWWWKASDRGRNISSWSICYRWAHVWNWNNSHSPQRWLIKHITSHSFPFYVFSLPFVFFLFLHEISAYSLKFLVVYKSVLFVCVIFSFNSLLLCKYPGNVRTWFLSARWWEMMINCCCRKWIVLRSQQWAVSPWQLCSSCLLLN